MAQPPSRLDPHEPSMEEILASIRSILNEEELKAPSSTPDPDAPLELTESMLIETLSARTPPEPAQPAMPPLVVALPDSPAEPQPQAPEAGKRDSLLDPLASAAAAAALGQLAQAVARERRAPVQRVPGPSIEDVVREEMRPLLKAWLDQHLPGMVERLVRAEIERVMNRSEG